MGALQRTSDQASAQADTSDLDWDGDQLRKYKWWRKMPNRTYKQNAKFRPFIEYGIAFDRSITIVQTTEHGIELSLKNVAKGSFEEPHTPGGFRLKEASARTPRPATLTALPDSYRLGERYLDSIDTELFDFFASTITNERRVEHYRNKCGGSGLRFMATIFTELSTVTPEVAVWASGQLSSLIESGIQVATSVGFDTYTEAYDELNMQSGDRQAPRYGQSGRLARGRT